MLRIFPSIFRSRSLTKISNGSGDSKNVLHYSATAQGIDLCPVRRKVRIGFTWRLRRSADSRPTRGRPLDLGFSSQIVACVAGLGSSLNLTCSLVRARGTLVLVAMYGRDLPQRFGCGVETGPTRAQLQISEFPFDIVLPLGPIHVTGPVPDTAVKTYDEVSLQFPFLTYRSCL